MTDQVIAGEFTRWDMARLFWRQIGLAGDIFLSVLGAGFFALALVVFLDGFGFIETAIDLGTGSLLGSGLVIAVMGLFSVGVASEGPMTQPAYAYPELGLTAGRAFGVVVVSLLGLALAAVTAPTLSEISYPFELTVEIVRAASRAGLFIVLPLAVPVAWYLRRELPLVRVGWDRLVFLVTWFVSAWVMLASAI